MLNRRRSSGRVVATILFTDIVGSTEVAARLGDHAWRGLLDRYRASVRRLLQRFHGREIDAAGDGFFALFEAPVDALGCAMAVRALGGDLGIRVRSGVHAGEIELDHGKAIGIGVHIASRIQALAEPDSIVVSGTARDLAVGSGISLAPAGEHELRGVPGRWQLFVVDDPGAPGKDAPATFPPGGRTISVRTGLVSAVGIVALTVVLVAALQLRAPAGSGTLGSPGATPVGPASPPTGSPGSVAGGSSPSATLAPADSSPVPTDAPQPKRMVDGLSLPGTYLIAVPGRPVVALADPWQSYSGDNYERISVADRPGNSITFAAATTVPGDACGTTERRLTGDLGTAFLTWMRGNAALSVGPSIVRGSGPDASTQVDVDLVSSKSCATDPRTVRLVPLSVSPPGITLTSGTPSRLLVHSLGNRVLVIAVQSPTRDEFDRFLAQADAVLASIHFEST
jgi:class 3 adenylate cyclase